MTAFHVKRLPRHQGKAAWNEILGGQANPRVFDTPQTVDFAVIGGGFAGLSAARRLRQLNPDARIAVLEAGRIGEGASGRNSGFMIDLPHDLSSADYAGQGMDTDKKTIALNRKAIAFATEAVEEYDIQRDFFDPVGKVNGAASEKGHAHNLNYAHHLQTLGEQHEMLDAQSMTELTGSANYRSGLYTPGTVMLQPAGYVRGVARGLTATVDIFENSPVVSFCGQGQSWQVSTPKATLNAGQLVLANNGHLESFGFARNRLMHIFLYASMTADIGHDALARLGGQPRWGVTPADPMGTTMRRIDTPLGGNRIITRVCASYHPSMETSPSELNRAAKVQMRKFLARFPALKDCLIEYCWAGHICLSRNNVSVAREIEKGVFAACCQNGLGTVRGTLTGIAAADLASGQPSAISQHFVSENHPKRLPPPPFASIGANAYLRWKEWAAGAE